MTTDDQWTVAGNEPRLEDVLSDPATRTLMQADGIDDAAMQALIERMRPCVSPLDFVPPARERPDPAMRTSAKYVRRQPARSHDDKASMQAAAGVVSRWIAALVTDKRASLD